METTNALSSAAGIGEREYVDTSPRGLAALARDAVKVAWSSPLLFVVAPMLAYFPLDWGAGAASASRIAALVQITAYAFRVVELFVGAFVTALVLLAAKALLETGARPSMPAAFDAARTRYASFLSTAWSALWRISLWTLCLVVPGVVVAVRWSLALSVCAMEGLEGPAALRRSEELVRGQGWRIFFLGAGAVLLCGLGGLVPAFFVTDDVSPLVLALAELPGHALLPLATVGALLLYLDTARTGGGFRPVRNVRAGDAAVSSGRLLVAAVVLAFLVALTAAVLSNMAAMLAQDDDVVDEPSGAVPHTERGS